MSATFAEQLSAWSTAATAVLTLVLVVAAFMAWRTAKDTLDASRRANEAAEAANEQARLDSIERTRPYVFVEIVPGLAGVRTFDIRILNSGQSAARNLTLEFDSWPDAPDDVAESVRTLFEKPRSLPPGTSLRAMWRLTGNFTNGTTEAGLGTSGTITAHYTGTDSSGERYTEQFDVPIADSGNWPVPEQGPNPPAEMNGDVLRFYKLVQVLVRRVGELRR